MPLKSLPVKDNVAGSAQNLTTRAFLVIYGEQMSTQVVLSGRIQADLTGLLRGQTQTRRSNKRSLGSIQAPGPITRGWLELARLAPPPLQPSQTKAAGAKQPTECGDQGVDWERRSPWLWHLGGRHGRHQRRQRLLAHGEHI